MSHRKKIILLRSIFLFILFLTRVRKRNQGKSKSATYYMSKNFVAIWMLQSISKTTRAKNVNFWIFVPNHLNILFAKFSILCFHPQDERLLSVLRSKNRSALLVYLEEFHSKFFYFFSTDHSHSKVKTLPISFSKDAKCSLSDLSQENKEASHLHN